ncbi:MAG: 5-(carboxyamino)imidazole ribonucleotide mutase [Firmicutes bacterium]|nr:5-(carboxyamino)imidazole ribonucleotide mutase [Bacillota bacterium]
MAFKCNRVGIVMGTDSDMGKMSRATEVLSDLGIEWELRVISAHRTPEVAAEYARRAEERGLAVIIAGAGMAAHLAGVMASYTVLPVIGVPLSSGALGGFDALCSTVMMPTGVPVATVAIDGAGNAAFLAAQILGLSDGELQRRLLEQRESLAERVGSADRRVQTDSGEAE